MKKVLITGAASGTGYAIGQRFAKEGYTVFLGSRDEDRAQEAAHRLTKEYGIQAYGVGMKVYDKASVEETMARMGEIDCLVCNAANLGINQETLSVDTDDFMDVIHTNIGWNFMLAQAAAQRMKDNGGGAIVFITSNTAYRAIPNRVAYSASKSGILGMARALALDLGKYNIRVNSVLPGMIKTERWDNNTNNVRSAPSVYTPLGDIANFEDIANAAYFLGSEQSRNTTGAELSVDGGNMIQLYPIIPERE